MTDLTWLEAAPLSALMAEAAQKRDVAFGRNISYSRKVFIPLTKLCRDVCHYCTFAERPRAGHAAYLSADDVLAIARAGESAGCTEALFTLGDKPELRYRAAREALAELGHDTTISYLREMCALVLRETTLLPHVNPGVMTREEIAGLREVSASQGIMLESTSERICEPGGVRKVTTWPIWWPRWSGRGGACVRSNRCARVWKRFICARVPPPPPARPARMTTNFASREPFFPSTPPRTHQAFRPQTHVPRVWGVFAGGGSGVVFVAPAKAAGGVPAHHRRQRLRV